MKTRRILPVVLSAICGVATVRANLLVNGDFEAQPNWGINGDGGYTMLTGNQLPGWTIESGHAVTIHNPAFYPWISGTYSVNTDGEGFNGQNADLWQTFNTVAGQQYLLEYDWKGWMQNIGTLDVRLTDVGNNTVVEDQHDWDSGGVHHMALDFIGDGGIMTLRVFGNPETGINDNQMIVDNFSVTPVPEPLTIVSLGAAMIVIVRRRRHN